MRITGSPYEVIGILAISFIVLTALGVIFAVRGVKTANSDVDVEFTTINKLENTFLKIGKRSGNRCILYISISSDNFCGPNGDKALLSDIVTILLHTFSGEESVISTYGEKVFVALSNWDREGAEKKIEACQRKLNQCFLKHSALNIADVRIGSYFAVGTQVTLDDAISRAMQACMLAKNENLAYAEWDVTSGKALEKKIKIENNIEKEIDNNRFFLEYQPVLDAETKKIIGAEVLARLNSETDGVLTPHSFLSAVDSAGVSEKFDYYIFEKNCKWISNNKEQREGYKYTINFSRSTLCEPAFVEKILSIAKKYDLQFSCLAVEILEDKDVTDEAREQMIENLAEKKEKGVSVLLDDFGSGYTTFGDLQNLDISIVKIDKSITHSSVTDNGFIILKNIIRTSKDIGFKTLCEGIETKEQEEAAIRAGCDFLQGFYYYRPMPVAALERLINEDLGGN